METIKVDGCTSAKLDFDIRLPNTTEDKRETFHKFIKERINRVITGIETTQNNVDKLGDNPVVNRIPLMQNRRKELLYLGELECLTMIRDQFEELFFD